MIQLWNQRWFTVRHNLCRKIGWSRATFISLIPKFLLEPHLRQEMRESLTFARYLTGCKLLEFQVLLACSPWKWPRDYLSMCFWASRDLNCYFYDTFPLALCVCKSVHVWCDMHVAEERNCISPSQNNKPWKGKPQNEERIILFKLHWRMPKSSKIKAIFRFSYTLLNNDKW